MNRLYCVQWSGKCYVWAQDETDARHTAMVHLICESADDAGVYPGITTKVIPSEDPHEWRNGLPYGDDPTGLERTVGDVIQWMREETND